MATATRTRAKVPMLIVCGVITGGAMLLAAAVQVVVPAWAVSGIAVLLGVVAGLVVAGLIRDQQVRRERAAAAACAALPFYQALTDAALDLPDLPVWPTARDTTGSSAGENSASGNPDQLAWPVVDAARALAFRPAPVRQAADAVVTGARDVASVVVEIRATSKPGRAGAVDARVADRHTTAVAALRDAHDRFVTVCRTDVGVEREHAQRRPRFRLTPRSDGMSR